MSNSEDNFFYCDYYQKYNKIVKSGVRVENPIRTVEELRAEARHAIQVLPPDEYKEEFETTENVPTDEEAKEDGYWSIRIWTELPDQYHFMAPVIVSKSE